MDDDEIEVTLRDPRVVAERAIVLSTVLRRLALEFSSSFGSDELAAAFDLREWLQDQRLGGALTRQDARFLAAPVGSLDPETIAEASWQGEGLSVLTWALRLSQLPAPTSRADVPLVLEALPMPWDATDPLIASAQLVAESEIAREREKVDLWHWRMSAEALRRAAPPHDRHDLDAAIHEAAREAAIAGLIHEECDGDFSFGGRGVKTLTDKDIEPLVAVTGERLRALNWVCGFGASWDDVPLDV